MLGGGGAIGDGWRGDDGGCVGGGKALKPAAQERAHFHHLVNEAVEQRDVDELGVGSGDVKLAGTVHVNASSGGGGQRAMAERYEFGAACVAGAGVGKNLFRLEIEKAQAHRAMTEDAF